MTRGLRSGAFAVGALLVLAGCSDPPDAFSRDDAAATIDVPVVVDSDVTGVDRPDVPSIDRPDVQVADRPDVQSVDRPDVQSAPDVQNAPDVTSTERSDYRCGPSFEGARCGPGRCCSFAEWCGNRDEPHCNESRGFEGMYDGP